MHCRTYQYSHSSEHGGYIKAYDTDTKVPVNSKAAISMPLRGGELEFMLFVGREVASFCKGKKVYAITEHGAGHLTYSYIRIYWDHWKDMC